MKKGDTNVIGLRLAELDNSSSVSLMLNSAYPTAAGLRVSPRLQYSHQSYSNSSDTETTISAGLRLEYLWGKIYSFEFDSGMDWSNRQVWFGSQKYQSYYINLGYRIDF